MAINKELAEYISEMAEADQGVRKMRPRDPELLYGIPNYLVYAIDGVNNWRIHKIIEKHGYPTQKLVGKRGMFKFWILIQHQDFDHELQKICLEQCDFNEQNNALLTDRVLVNAGKSQIYGTQFYRNKKGEMVSRPIKDRGNLSKRRKAVGLGSFSEDKKLIEKIGKETKRLDYIFRKLH